MSGQPWGQRTSRSRHAGLRTSLREKGTGLFAACLSHKKVYPVKSSPEASMPLKQADDASAQEFRDLADTLDTESRLSFMVAGSRWNQIPISTSRREYPAMRTPLEIAVIKTTPVEAKPRTLGQDAASVSRPFSHILAEAESVQDVVTLSGNFPPTASAVGAWRDAWLGLCRGANLLMSGELTQDTFSRQRKRGIRS